MARLSKVVLVTLGSLTGVNAWGVLGHATVAYIAQNYVSSSTASWAQGVLGDTSTSYLANIASWADQYRTTTAGKWSAPLHFIDAEDNPPTSCNVDYTRDCGSSGCSISAIANYTQRAGDGRLSTANIAEAVKFLVHFLGDVTQPLHDEAYEVGGNSIKVTFDGYSDNLHSDWDTYMPEKLIGGSSLTDAQSWANTLINEINSGSYKSQAASWIQGDDISDPVTTATRWASDANAYVCTVVMPDGAAALETGDLYPTYYNSAIGTIELQIAKGGYRLANWLNMIYNNEIAKRDLESFVNKARSDVRDLMGRDLLPESRPLSRAQLARDAMGGDCCGSARHAH
ncbi:Nuclease PA3 [Penicillium daleae]|uniref:Nuclease PA3 n=1 Tax=Penicillium daleae TaxID=63821 RepID=A0AAD6G8K3_9EURO|nr:Nuclease PA3 [Penicillium daleae]KAJ5464516.1 Nuclease PA3 [Penicillium daleae]